MQNRRHIVLIGPMGSGKSTVGAALAAQLELPFVDLDAHVTANAGCDIPTLFANEGEQGFRARESAALDVALAGNASVIATGGGAVLAQANRKAMCDAGTVIYLQVDPAIQLARVAGDTGRPLLQGDDPAQRMALLQAQREPLYREAAHHVLDASALAPDDAAAAIIRLLDPPKESDT